MRALLLVPALLLAACAADSPTNHDAEDGAPVAVTDAQGAVLVGEPPEGPFLPADSLVALADALDGQTVAVEGVVAKVCRKKGCWLTLQTASGETIRVNVPKDEGGAYRFTFPTDLAQARAQLVGTFAVDEESVALQQHLAEDEGASAEEVAAIAAPRRALTITPRGARLVRAAAPSAGDVAAGDVAADDAATDAAADV